MQILGLDLRPTESGLYGGVSIPILTSPQMPLKSENPWFTLAGTEITKSYTN